jgi:acyl carrier protein
MTEIQDRLTEILSKVLLVEKDEVTDDIRRKDHEAWDSMAHLVIISEVENEFEVFFEDEEVIDIWTVGDLRTVLDRKKNP